MDVNQAAVFLAGSILTGLGFIVVAGVILIVNNLFSKFWKPIEWERFLPESMRHPTTYVDQEPKK